MSPPPPRQRCPLSGPLIDSLWTDASQVSDCDCNRDSKTPVMWQEVRGSDITTAPLSVQDTSSSLTMDMESKPFWFLLPMLVDCDLDPRTRCWMSLGLEASISAWRLEASYTSISVFLYQWGKLYLFFQASHQNADNEFSNTWINRPER